MSENIIHPPAEMLDSLKQRYNEPTRAYHTWRHIEALLTHFNSRRDLIGDQTAVIWAIYWHDAIYDPRSPDNERLSAHQFEREAAEFLDESTIKSTSRMILTTIKHELPDDGDTRWRKDCGVFLDFDLSILAARPDVFDDYEANVRKEYSFIDDSFFRAGRKAILSRFLARPILYFSPELRTLWEQPARANLKRSIEALS